MLDDFNNNLKLILFIVEHLCTIVLTLIFHLDKRKLSFPYSSWWSLQANPKTSTFQTKITQSPHEIIRELYLDGMTHHITINISYKTWKCVVNINTTEHFSVIFRVYINRFFICWFSFLPFTFSVFSKTNAEKWSHRRRKTARGHIHQKLLKKNHKRIIHISTAYLINCKWFHFGPMVLVCCKKAKYRATGGNCKCEFPQFL